MRLTVNQYAKALHSSVKDKSENEIAGVTSNFIKLLQKNNQIKLAEKIIEKFSVLWNGDRGILEVGVYSREELDAETVEKIKSFILKKYEAKEIILNKKINKKIKGGLILKVGDEMIDASVAGMISNLKNELIK